MSVDFSQRPKKTGKGFVENEGEKIFFESIGEGEAIVFCHGLGGNHVVFFQQVPELAKTHRVITIDQRGFGKSTNINGNSGPITAADDIRAVLDSLDIQKAYLVGQSLGGWAVLNFAVRYPERSLGIVFSNSIAGIYTDEIAYMYEIPAPRPPVDTLPLGKHFGLADGFYERNPSNAFLYLEIGTLSPTPPKDMRVLIRRTYVPLERVNELSKSVPMLFISGSEDITFPPYWIEKLQELVTQSELTIFEGTAHSPYFEVPEAYNKRILEFVNK